MDEIQKKSIEENLGNLRNSEMQRDLRQTLRFEEFFHPNGDLVGDNSKQREDNRKTFNKLRNELARSSDVDYRIIEDIVVKGKFTQTLATEKKLRYLAEAHGLSVPLIITETDLMQAYDFDKPARMSLKINTHVVADTLNLADQEAKHSWEFAQIMDLLDDIKNIFDKDFPVDIYTYHKVLVPKFVGDEKVKKLRNLLNEYNIALYGRRMHQWLHDEEGDHLIAFKLVKFPYQTQDGQSVEAYEVAINSQIFCYVHDPKPIKYKDEPKK